MYLAIVCSRHLNVSLFINMRLAIINILFDSIIGNYIGHKITILKQHIYNRIQIFILAIVVDFAKNYRTSGLLCAIINLVSSLHIPKTP